MSIATINVSEVSRCPGRKANDAPWQEHYRRINQLGERYDAEGNTAMRI
jgi:hypothetical protein